MMILLPLRRYLQRHAADSIRDAATVVMILRASCRMMTVRFTRVYAAPRAGRERCYVG